MSLQQVSLERGRGVQVLALAVATAAASVFAPQHALARWEGASTGTTAAPPVDQARDYNDVTNWVGDSIDHSFAGFTLTGALVVQVSAPFSLGASGWNFGYGGNFNLSLHGGSAGPTVITLNGVGVANVDFDAGDDRTVTIGNTTNQLELATNGINNTFTVTDSGDILDMLAIISGTGSISKAGPGRMNMTNAKTFSGGVTLSAGTIRLGSNSVVTGTAGSQVLESGPIGIGTLTLNGGTFQDNGTRTIGNNVVIGSGGTTFSSSSATGTLNIDGTGLATPATITLVGTPTITVTNTTNFRNPVLGSTFTKTGAGTLVLSADHSGSGPIPGTITGATVSGGIMRFDTATAIPGASGRTITAASGGTLSTGGALTFDQAFLDRIDVASAGVAGLPATSSVNVDFSAFPTLRLGATVAAGVTYSGVITPNNNTYRLGGGGGTLTVSSLLAAGNTLNVGNNGSATGAVIVTNTSNAVTSTTVDGGVLVLPTDGAAGDPTSPLGPVPAAPTNNITLQGGGLLRLVATSTLSPNRSIVLGTGGGGVDTNGLSAPVTNAISGTGPLIKTGAGVLTLATANPMTGGLTVTGGSITFATSSGTTTANGPVDVAANAPGTVVLAAGTTFVMNASGSNFTLGNRTAAGADINDQFDASAAQAVSITAAKVQIGSDAISPDHTGSDPILTFTLPAGAGSSSTINAGTSISVGIGENNGAGSTTFTLGGGTNTIRTPLITVGENKVPGVIGFAAGSAGSLSLAETGGDGKTNLLIGDNPVGTGTQPLSTLDLTTTGTVTATLGTITLVSSNTNTGTTGGTRGTFTLAATGAGSAVTADTVIVGVSTSGTTVASTSTFNLDAGTFTFNSGGTGFVQGTGTITTRFFNLNVTGGLLNMNGKPINNIGTAALSLTGGVIANASTINVDTLTFTGGTIRDAAAIALAVTQTGAATRLEVTSALAGTGTSIAGNYTLTGGTAQVAAGKTLSIAGDMTVDPTAGGTLAVELNGAANGKFTLTGTGLLGLASTTADVLSLTALTDINTPTVYTVASFVGRAPGDFDFESVLINGVPAQSGDPSAVNYVNVVYNPMDIQITVDHVQAVPEPSVAGVLGVLAGAGLLTRRRRRV